MILFNLLVLAAAISGSIASKICVNETKVSDQLVKKVDFLFLLDASGSMGRYISGVAQGFVQFRNLIAQNEIDARFSVVRFSETPALYLPLTENVDDFAEAVNKIKAQSLGSQEAAFEAIRGSLPPENGRYFQKYCPTKYSDCTLNWRDDALKVLVQATDEASSLPLLERYRELGQNAESSFCSGAYREASPSSKCVSGEQYRFEPAFKPATVRANKNGVNEMYRSGSPLRLTDPWERELKKTADLLISEGVFMNSLISRDLFDMAPKSAFDSSNALWNNISEFIRPESDHVNVQLYQFGDPLLAYQMPDYSRFDPQRTLDNLKKYNLENSLQARLLEAKEFMRLYDIHDFEDAKQPEIIGAFYNQLVNSVVSIVETCSFPSDETDTTEETVPTPENPPTRPPSSNDSGNEAGNATGNGPYIGGIIGGIAAALVAFAGVAIFIYRKNKPSELRITHNAFHSSGNIVDNPLYKGPTLHENPLYDAPGSREDLSNFRSNDALAV